VNSLYPISAGRLRSFFVPPIPESFRETIELDVYCVPFLKINKNKKMSKRKEKRKKKEKKEKRKENIPAQCYGGQQT
jgi:hypothetical protein